MKIGKRGFTALAALVAGLVLSATAGPASATTPDDNTVTITATVVGSSIASANAHSTSEATGSSYAYAVAWATSHAAINKADCEWSTGINTYWSGGVFHRSYDPVAAHICRLVHPVTVYGVTYHWKKIGGGTSGANCGNLFVPTHENVSYTQVAFLDVKAGTVAKVAVHSKVCVAVNVNVNVELQYTYQGETHTVYKNNSASDSACKSKSATAEKRITKHTTRRASARSIAKAKAAVRTAAKATATTRATAKARAKAVATVSVTITITPPTAPSIAASANGCIGPDSPTADVTVNYTDTNADDTSVTTTLDNQSKQGSLTNGQGTVTYTVTSAGTHNGSVTGNPSGLSTSFSVTVPVCPTPPQHTTTLSCMSQEEITQGDTSLATCSVSDDNGAPIQLTAVSQNGNAHVSGIVCEQTGNGFCPSGGTFDVSITGDNVGTFVIDATAHANGVDSNVAHMTGPVDPSGGGF